MFNQKTNYFMDDLTLQTLLTNTF